MVLGLMAMETKDRDSKAAPTWQAATSQWLINNLSSADTDTHEAPQRMSQDDIGSLEQVAKKGSPNIYFNKALEDRFRFEQRQANRSPRIAICAIAVVLYGLAPLWASWALNLPDATGMLASKLSLWVIVPFHIIAGLAQYFWVATELAEVLLLIGFCMQIVCIELLRVHASIAGVHLGPMLIASTPISAFSMISLSLSRRTILFLVFIATLFSSYAFFNDGLFQLSNGELFGAVLIVVMSLVGTMFFQVSVRRGWAANNLLEVSAGQDILTGLPNRFAFLGHVETYLRSAQRYDKLCMLALIDLDHFKKINDHYGHVYGDGVLLEVGLCLDQFSRRAGDFVARVGGEEFAVFLYDCTLEGAKRRLNDLTDSICDLGIDHDANPGGIVTASVGAVMMSPTASLSTAYAAADKHLYRAKGLGRNRVVFGTQVV